MEESCRQLKCVKNGIVFFWGKNQQESVPKPKHLNYVF